MCTQNNQELYSPRTLTSRGQSVLQMISWVVWCFNGFHRIECKITPGMELFEQQYFTEQYILKRTEEGHEKD